MGTLDMKLALAGGTMVAATALAAIVLLIAAAASNFVGAANKTLDDFLQSLLSLAACSFTSAAQVDLNLSTDSELLPCGQSTNADMLLQQHSIWSHSCLDATPGLPYPLCCCLSASELLMLPHTLDAPVPPWKSPGTALALP